MKIWLTNAYNSNNLGDDFLLHEVVRVAAIPDDWRTSLTVVSNHPGAIGTELNAIPLPGWVPPSSPLPLTAGKGLLNLARLSRIPREIRPDVLLVMAGGYTAIKAPLDALLFANDHFVPLDLARRYGIPAIMFPVSIGPINRLAWPFLKRTYESFHSIFLRDDESVAELSGLTNTFRVPDLAVQSIANMESNGGSISPGRSVCLIARALDGSEIYQAKLQDLDKALNRREDKLWRLQVPKDAAFYEIAGLPYSKNALEYQSLSADTSVTVSVRLHGALMSILNQVPAVHLSYDRKGAGAYGDLGLSKWLHSAWDFDPQVVADQANALSRDATEFWQAIEDARPVLREIINTQSQRIQDFWTSLRSELKHQ